MPNTRGARWNPAGTPALYASLARETALAEAEHQISLQPVRPRARRNLHRLDVRLARVLDLRDDAVRRRLGIGTSDLSDVGLAACQRIGGAAAQRGFEGMLVPSARHDGANLVVFTANLAAKSSVAVASTEVLGAT